MNLIGVFGDLAAARPDTVTAVGELEGHPPLGSIWQTINPGLSSTFV